jgi:tetratricopeptide (TPR) repeat protein
MKMFRALELSPNNSHYRTLKISLLAKIGYKEFSADQFEQFLTALKSDYSKSDPQTGREDFGRQISDVLFASAGAFHGRGEETEEMADLAETVRYYPNDFNYRKRAMVYLDHDLFEKAIEDYTKALALSPTVEIFPLERADAYVYAGKLNEALKDYDNALKLDPSLKDVIDAKKAWAIERLAKK